MQPIIEERQDLMELVSRLRIIAATLKNLSSDGACVREQVDKLSKERKLILAHFRYLRPFRRQKVRLSHMRTHAGA